LFYNHAHEYIVPIFSKTTGLVFHNVDTGLGRVGLDDADIGHVKVFDTVRNFHLGLSGIDIYDVADDYCNHNAICGVYRGYVCI